MTFFTYDDDEIPDDVIVVLETSSVLDIAEFEIFKLSYSHWYGKEAPPELIERIYSAYMFNSAVPPWVRQFCREVLSRERQGALDRRAFGIPDEPFVESRYRRGMRMTFFMVLYLIAIHLLAYLVTLDD